MSIAIRRATPKDAAAYARLMSHPEIFPNLMQLPYNDEEQWRARLTETCAPGKPDLPLVAELHGEVVGNSGLHPAGPALRRRHVMTLGICVAAESQGRGVGSALMGAMLDFADNWAAALRLELTVYTDNDRAIALYRKFGFEIEGTFKGYVMRNGQFTDAYAMARFHPNPPRISA
jgi:putative acetyltransferase